MKYRDPRGVTLEELFEEFEKEPGWAEAYARAELEDRIALQISCLRAAAKLNQKALAKAIGTTQSVISRIEKGAQNLTLATLRKIAKALDREVHIELRPRQ